LRDLSVKPSLGRLPIAFHGRWRNLERVRRLFEQTWIHELDATAVDYHPDGKHFLSTGVVGFVRVWSLETKTIVAQGRRSARIRDARFSPDGDTILLVIAGNFARRWNWRENEWIQSFRRPPVVLCVDTSPDGKFVATGNAADRLAIWDNESGERLAEVDVTPRFERPQRHVWRARFCPKGEWIAAASKNGEVYVYTVPDLDLVHTFRGSRSRAWDVAFSNDRSELFSSANDGTIRVWSLKTGRESRVLTGSTKPVKELAPIGTSRFSSPDARTASPDSGTHGSAARTSSSADTPPMQTRSRFSRTAPCGSGTSRESRRSSRSAVTRAGSSPCASRVTDLDSSRRLPTT